MQGSPDALKTRPTQSHRFQEAFFGKGRKILAAVAAEYQTTGSAVVFPSPEPEFDLTRLTSRNRVVWYPQNGKRRITIIDSFPRAVWVFRVAINYRMLLKNREITSMKERGNEISLTISSDWLLATFLSLVLPLHWHELFFSRANLMKWSSRWRASSFSCERKKSEQKTQLIIVKVDFVFVENVFVTGQERNDN